MAEHCGRGGHDYGDNLHCGRCGAGRGDMTCAHAEPDGNGCCSKCGWVLIPAAFRARRTVKHKCPACGGRTQRKPRLFDGASLTDNRCQRCADMNRTPLNLFNQEP